MLSKQDQLIHDTTKWFISLATEIDYLDSKLQDMHLEIKSLVLRLAVVETRIEERSDRLLETSIPKSSPGKRGRPKKVIEE